MKRTLILLPLVALALGLLLFLLRRPEALSILSRPPQAAPQQPETHVHGPSQAPAPAPEPVIPGDKSGSIRFTIMTGGQPVTDSKITVQRSGSTDFMVFSTEKDGTQILRGLPPAEYSILVEHPKYMEHSAEVTLAPGQTLQIPVEMRRGASVYGVVRDRAGNPLPGTRVVLLVNGEFPVTRMGVHTDDKGAYAINGVPPGSFGIRFRHPEHKPQDHPDLLFRSPADQYEVNKVLELGARVTGRVLDEPGLPIEGALVVFNNGKSAGLQKTDKNGVFVIPGLTEGAAPVTVTKAGYGKAAVPDVTPGGADVEIRLSAAAKISGKVVVEEPPRQIQVVLGRFDPKTNRDVLFDSKFFPDPPDGAFTYPDVAPGTYSVEILIEGYVANEHPRITLAPGQTLEGLVVTFRKKI
jgi:protocatechuate 3,4-dioxygenase beta subunit